MRTIWLLALSLSGCSVLDRIDLPAGRSFDPNKVYLTGKDTVDIGIRDDKDRYECLTPPMVCDLWGSTWRCRCS